jgi:hypothetical protein
MRTYRLSWPFAALVSGILTVVFAVATGLGADKFPSFTDAKSAGLEFDLQGEYVGEVQQENEKQKIGVQVIALGAGKFRALGFIGGLPGDGWSRGGEIRMSDGQLDGSVVRFMEGETVAELKSGVITVTHNGNQVAELAKVLRQSPTLGAKPPSGAIVLFDGSSADHFENGKIVEGNLLGATSCSSKQKFGDHSLHIEFRTPFMPTASGQARGNSGVYAQGR